MRQQQAFHGFDGRVFQQRRATFGNHDRIQHAFAEVAFGGLFRHAFDDFRRTQHTDFISADLKILLNRGNLRGNHVGRYRMHCRYAQSILCGNRCQYAGTEHAAHLKCLQIRLYACAAAGI